MTAKTAFLSAVEDVVARCLIPVPSAPLRALSEAVAAGTEAVESGTETGEELERLWEVYDAAENLEWSFWPDTDFGSTEALVHPDTVQSLADALHAYRVAEKERT